MLPLQVQADAVEVFVGDALHDQCAIGLTAFEHACAEGQVRRVRPNQRVRQAQCVACKARPPVVAGVRHHPRAHRIEFDIAVAAQQVGLVIDQAGFVTAFPKGAGAAIAVVDVAHVAPAQRLHHARHQSAGDRRHQQMDVVGHQHIRVHRTAFAQGDLAQLAEVTVMIGVGEEARLPIVSALDDVLRNTGKVESGLAWHDARDMG